MSPTRKFREELIKIMPGYKWTVHREFMQDNEYIRATGIQSAGFNRMSTLEVVRREEDGRVSYEARSSGYGLHARWLSENSDATLASALRGLQNHYEDRARSYRSHADALALGRKAPSPDTDA